MWLQHLHRCWLSIRLSSCWWFKEKQGTLEHLLYRRVNLGEEQHCMGERRQGGWVAPQDVHNVDLDLIVSYRRKAEKGVLPGHTEAVFCSVFQSSKSYSHSSVKWKHKHQHHTSYILIAILTISQKAVVLMFFSFSHKLPIYLCTQAYSQLKRDRDQENKTFYI